MAVTPSRNRVSITNISSRIGRLWKAVFPSSSRSIPQSADLINIKDSDGNPYYTTVAQLTAGISGSMVMSSYLSTVLPSAVPAGQLIYVSDLGVMAYSNGSNWVS